VSLASCSHDWGFEYGRNKRRFHKANLYFLFNINQILREHSANEFIKDLRFMLVE
jgi:hypothetical protein